VTRVGARQHQHVFQQMRRILGFRQNVFEPFPAIHRQKMCIRDSTMAAERYNGLVQQQIVVSNPDFYPAVPSPAALAGFQSTQVIQEIGSRLRAPYILQSAVSMERQLPANTTLAVTYTNSHGLHVLRSEDINAPRTGTYDPNVPNSGVFPLGHPGACLLYTSKA